MSSTILMDCKRYKMHTKVVMKERIHEISHGVNIFIFYHSLTY